MNKIDFVIPWVDGNDLEWQKEKEKFDHNSLGDNRNIRYRDFENLKYWFRGVEKYAPWVNKIHFITWGHLPEWLDTNHPKLNIVRHEDYIPEKYLPTFNSTVIEMNLHRLEDLSEQFVYFNDDFFLIDKVKKTDFFKNDLPSELAALSIAIARDPVHGTMNANAIYMLNKHFNKRKTIKKNFAKWYNLKSGKYILRTMSLSLWGYFTGFQDMHLASPFLKSTFNEVWEKEYQELNKACTYKFRDPRGYNQNLFKYWQFASGNFEPNQQIGEYYNVGLRDKDTLIALNQKKHKMVCLNDSEIIKDFEKMKREINFQFLKLFPEKSEYEK